MQFNPTYQSFGVTLARLFKENLDGIAPSSLADPTALQPIVILRGLDSGVCINTLNPYNDNVGERNSNKSPEDENRSETLYIIGMLVYVQPGCLVEIWSGDTPLYAFGWSSYLYQLPSNTPQNFRLEQAANEAQMYEYLQTINFQHVDVRPYNYDNRLALSMVRFIAENLRGNFTYRLRAFLRDEPAYPGDDGYYKPGNNVGGSSIVNSFFIDEVRTLPVFEGQPKGGDGYPVEYGRGPTLAQPYYFVNRTNYPGVSLGGVGPMDSYLDIKT